MLVVTHNDLTTLAGTLYGEIRGGTQAQRENVAQLIMNRYAGHWAPSIKQVCLAPHQFSCWLSSDPNYKKILDAPEQDPTVWDELMVIAQNALKGVLPNRISNADSYYACSVKIAPNWAKSPARVILNDNAHIYLRVRP